MMNDEDIINFYIDNDTLISPELLSYAREKPLPIRNKFSVLTKDIDILLSKGISFDVSDFERATVLKEKHKNLKAYNSMLDSLTHSGEREIIPNSSQHSVETSVANKENSPADAEQQSTSQLIKIGAGIQGASEEFLLKNKIKIVSSYLQKTRKWSVGDFVGLYNARYRDIEKILRSRQELQNLTSISRILSKKERENVAFVGVVFDKGLTKSGNIMLTIEDPTGMVKVVVNKGKEDLFRLAGEIQFDETIGVAGMYDNIVFANNIFIPDIPLTKELKKSPEEGYFVLISDTQIGNKLFLEKEFNKFISWLSGEIGTEKQKEVASKVKYVFFAGDLVEGVGIYPDQEYNLSIIDIYDQYKAAAEMLKKIPSHLPIIFCLGNHDVGRISEPQPALTSEYAAPVLALPNVIPVSNPSIINIYAQSEKGFDGLDVMLYHGGSFFYYANNLMSIRRGGGYRRSDLIMRYLLQRRHLAPSHTATLYIPDPKKDPLVIDKVPDFLFSGHLHRASVNNYRNVTCINASCWVSKSPEEERRGLDPQPARAFIIDMQTREVKIMNFLSKEDQEKEQPGAKEADNG